MDNYFEFFMRLLGILRLKFALGMLAPICHIEFLKDLHLTHLSCEAFYSGIKNYLFA